MRQQTLNLNELSLPTGRRITGGGLRLTGSHPIRVWSVWPPAPPCC